MCSLVGCLSVQETESVGSVVFIHDLSFNGTFLNGTKIGMHLSTVLLWYSAVHYGICCVAPTVVDAVLLFTFLFFYWCLQTVLSTMLSELFMFETDHRRPFNKRASLLICFSKPWFQFAWCHNGYRNSEIYKLPSYDVAQEQQLNWEERWGWDIMKGCKFLKVVQWISGSDWYQLPVCILYCYFEMTWWNWFTFNKDMCKNDFYIFHKEKLTFC